VFSEPPYLHQMQTSWHKKKPEQTKPINYPHPQPQKIILTDKKLIGILSLLNSGLINKFTSFSLSYNIAQSICLNRPAPRNLEQFKPKQILADEAASLVTNSISIKPRN